MIRPFGRGRSPRRKTRFVPGEGENRAKWPKAVKVSGNRLVVADGAEVWLQGLNAGGLESFPPDFRCGFGFKALRTPRWEMPGRWNSDAH